MKLAYELKVISHRVENALWSYFAGDALASPTHWFYGGFPQIQEYYGPDGIVGYTKPVLEFMSSYLGKSDLSGGINAPSSSSDAVPPSIIGYVINHGKQEYWDPNKNFNYHATLAAGENTLEVQLGRVLMKSIVANKGHFHADHFRDAFVEFMTTPCSHNDSWASTCHRIFFAKYAYQKLPPEQCPDTTHVDNIDGLVLPTITALAVAAQPEATLEDVRRQCAETVAVTRNSQQLEQYASAWGELIYAIVRKSGDDDDAAPIMAAAVRHMAETLQLRPPEIRHEEPVTSCAMNPAVPQLLDSLLKYAGDSTTKDDDDVVWRALLANANAGGENVHRGSPLGAALGACHATAKSEKMMTGLYDYASLQNEIHDFLQATTTVTTTK